MLVIQRFRVPVEGAEQFPARLDAAYAHLAAQPGLESIDAQRNVDDPELWVLVTRWDSVGAYRRALGGVAAKYALMPVMAHAIDEPSAYLPVGELGDNVPRGA